VNRRSASPSVRALAPSTARGRKRGLAGLEDLPRPVPASPPPETLRKRVLQLTLTEPATQYGTTHWSSRLLAAAPAAEGTPDTVITKATHPRHRKTQTTSVTEHW